MMEVIIVIVIIALITAVAVRGLAAPRSPGMVRLQVKGEIQRLFKNASIRSRSFQEVIKVTLKPQEDEALTFKLSTERQNSDFGQLTSIDQTEEQELAAQEKKNTRFTWTGEDSYTLDDEVKITDYEELLDEDGEIHFFFYPDGEASGPNLRLSVGDFEFNLKVDRLNSQVNLQQIEE